MRATITILFDNNRHDPRLRTEWGFSCLVKGLDKTILFDTGCEGPGLLYNMDQLGIDPGDVDAVILSHFHSDHTGGLMGFLERSRKPKVYLPSSFPEGFKRRIRARGAEVEEVRQARVESRSIRPSPRQWFRAKPSRSTGNGSGLMERMIHIIAYMKKPVIASAHGYAVANGAGIIAACDLAIVAEGTKIGATAINVGLFCMGPAVPLSRSLGRKRCLEMVMPGDMIEAETAERWGLVNKVVPADRLEEETMALAEKLAEKSPVALQMCKQAFHGMSDLEYGKALAYSNELFAALCATEDAKEGVDAFLHKRKPQWKGR